MKCWSYATAPSPATYGLKSHKTSYTVAAMGRDASPIEHRSLFLICRLQSLVAPKLAEQFESSRSEPRVMIIRKRQNHDSPLVNFLEQLDPFDQLSLTIDDYF